MEKGSALVQGEDSESDEEINTEHLTTRMETSLRRTATNSPQKRESFGKPGIVAGEGSETDEEDETDGGSGSALSGQTGRATLRVLSIRSGDVSNGSSPRSSRRSSGDSSAVPPPSLLHKKLREKNLSLRKNIVDRVLRIYHATCRNLTVVNDNLSRNQATIEKVNSQLKKADQDLEKVNLAMELIMEGASSFAPTLRMGVHFTQKPSPSASRPASLSRSTSSSGQPSSCQQPQQQQAASIAASQTS